MGSVDGIQWIRTNEQLITPGIIHYTKWLNVGWMVGQRPRALAHHSTSVSHGDKSSEAVKNIKVLILHLTWNMDHWDRLKLRGITREGMPRIPAKMSR